MTLSVVMITYNSADVVEGAMRSIEGMWDELLVGDGGSRDGTVEMVRKYGAKVYRLDPRLRGDDKRERGDDKKKGMINRNLGERKQELVGKAKGDWILVLDADERVSGELKKEIASITHPLPPSEVEKHVAYRIPYQNYVFGKPVYYGGEKYAKVRLFRRGFARISPEPLHEEIILNGQTHKATPCKSQGSGLEGGKVGELKGIIYHHSYRTPWQLFSKFTRYAWIGASVKNKKEAGSRVKPGMTMERLFLYGPHMVWARFVKEKGYKDGWRGLVLAIAFGYMEGLTYWFVFTIFIRHALAVLREHVLQNHEVSVW